MAQNANAWASALQPASWRGVPFTLLRTEPTDGRRLAIHSYPGRDLPWAEDLGRAIQEIPIEAYLSGDDVYAQRDKLKTACAQPGPGTLVHPSLGSIQATLRASSFGETAEEGRMVRVRLSFLITSPQTYPGLNPTVAKDSKAAVKSAADDVKAATDKNFFERVGDAVKSGAATVQSAVSSVQGFVTDVKSQVNSVLAPLKAVDGFVSSVTGKSFGISAITNKIFNNPILNRFESTLSQASSISGLAGKAVDTIAGIPAKASAFVTQARTAVDTAATKVFNFAKSL